MISLKKTNLEETRLDRTEIQTKPNTNQSKPNYLWFTSVGKILEPNYLNQTEIKPIK